MVDRSAVLYRRPLGILRKHKREKAPLIEGASVYPNLRSHRHQWLRPSVLEWGEFDVFARVVMLEPTCGTVVRRCTEDGLLGSKAGGFY